MTGSDWIALAVIALPLFGKCAIDVAAYLAARKHTALAAIVGMAGRQAASVARELASLPPGANGVQLEQSLIRSSTTAIMTEMNGRAATLGANDGKVATIVQGELDKLRVPLALAPVLPASPV